MDKWQTQDVFWNSFGLPAYDELTTFDEGDEPAFPHITYQAMNGVMDQNLTINASLWYKTPTWAEISQKADDILAAISKGIVLTVDNGFFWIKSPGATPFAQRIDSGDERVKRILLTVEAEALTAD